MNQRQIAIFADAHALLEPTKAALEDMKERGITEIYSLGDNIGVGPNPKEVMELLEEYGVVSLAGNSEEYVTLGIEPFTSYFHELKRQSHLWTLSKLGEHEKAKISLFPHSIELLLGGKKIALCHFANDVRFDYQENSTWKYQANIRNRIAGYPQFQYTNSAKQLRDIEMILNKYGKYSPMMKGYLSALQDPLFQGKQVDFFDAVIQGHVHWKIYEKSDSLAYYSIRAVGMAYGHDPIDTASYVILKEKENGFDFEEVLVEYDRDKMEYSILTSKCPDTQIRTFVGMNKQL